jgi:hypothetical protein
MKNVLGRSELSKVHGDKKSTESLARQCFQKKSSMLSSETLINHEFLFAQMMDF